MKKALVMIRKDLIRLDFSLPTSGEDGNGLLLLLSFDEAAWVCGLHHGLQISERIQRQKQIILLRWEKSFSIIQLKDKAVLVFFGEALRLKKWDIR